MNKQRNEGLCATCKRAAGCEFPVESDDPVLSCEAFVPLDHSLQRLEKVKEIGPRDPSRMNGLCGDCGNGESCVFRQREGGTWHCEEYC